MGRLLTVEAARTVVILLSVVSLARGDTPANCTYEDIEGDWIFSITKRDGNNTIDCSQPLEFETEYKVGLYYPSLAMDGLGNAGFWTLIYNQGFEVVIGGNKFFAFSLYKQSGSTVTSMCDQTFPGWVHQTDQRRWGCYVGKKVDSNPRPEKVVAVEKIQDTPMEFSFVDEINKQQTTWTATENNIFNGMKMSEAIRMAGGRSSARSFPPTSKVTRQQFEATKLLPTEFDWRNKDGQNFVSPIRNQGTCGSCYAFGSMALYEARERILTNNTVQKVYSTQDIVSCSEYSQGCDGGFPYLIAGKYGQDFGLIEEECFKYQGKDMPCMKTACQRHYTNDYFYVGGSYGACNEPLMREELVKNGPIAVSFEVYNDLLAYKGGIYQHTELGLNKYNPWEITNHVVLVVGYGEENGTPFWIVKNSWGPDWGEQGFFRILRGVDECSIESMAVGIMPSV